MANKLGKFTEEEDSYLKANYQLMTYKDMAKVLHRSLSFICKRTSELELHKRKFSKEIIPGSKVGCIVRPQPGVLIHYGIFSTSHSKRI